MAEVYDLWIVEGDLAFGADGEPLFLADAAAIAQDVKHRVLEAGVAQLLIAEDDTAGVGLQSVAQVVEQDLRVRPGTAVATGPDALGRVLIRATLMNGQTLSGAV